MDQLPFQLLAFGHVGDQHHPSGVGGAEGANGAAFLLALNDLGSGEDNVPRLAGGIEQNGLEDLIRRGRGARRPAGQVVRVGQKLPEFPARQSFPGPAPLGRLAVGVGDEAPVVQG